MFLENDKKVKLIDGIIWYIKTMMFEKDSDMIKCIITFMNSKVL